MHRVLNLRVFITKSTQPKSGFSVLSEFEHRVVCWCKACVDCVEMGWGGREGGGWGEQVNMHLFTPAATLDY